MVDEIIYSRIGIIDLKSIFDNFELFVLIFVILSLDNIINEELYFFR